MRFSLTARQAPDDGLARLCVHHPCGLALLAQSPMTPEPTVQESQAWLRKHALVLLASFAVAGGFAWLLRVGALPVVPPREAWQTVRAWVVVAYVALFIVLHLVRCSRWGLLIHKAERPSVWLTLWIGLVGYGALVVLPFRLGEAVRPALMRSRAKLPLGASAGVVGAERILDGLILSSILLVALLSAERRSPLPERIGSLPIPASIIPSLAFGGVIVFGGLSLTMAAVYLFRQALVRAIERHVSRLSPSLGHSAARVVASVTSGFRFLSDKETAPRFASLTALYWLLNVGSVWLLLWGSGVQSPTLAEASVILGVLGLGLVVPNAPGYFGTFQISAYSAMVLFYPLEVVTRAGSAFVFLLYVLQMVLTLAGAAVALFVRAEHRSIALSGIDGAPGQS